VFAALVRRHPVRSAVIAVALVAAAMPLLVYVVIPAFVKSTLVEDLPATAASSVAPPVKTVRRGELMRINAADYGSGLVRIVKIGPDRFLRFDDVDIAGAPDMYVYLSDRSDGQPGTFVDLGKLKATNGSFNYAIPTNVDITIVRSVVVWCRQFSVAVTFAVVE